MNDKLLGRMSAILEMTEDKVSELKEVEVGLTDVSRSLKNNARDIDELREVVNDVQDIIKEHTRPEWLTTKQLSKELGMRVETIRRLHKAGKIPGYKITEGSHLRFDRQEVYRGIKKTNKE